jgi:hypothetical protein
MSSNPLPKQSTSHHRPFISTKSIPTQVFKAMNMLKLLLENQAQPSLSLRIPPSKQLALRKIPYTSTGLQKNMKNIKCYNIN